ncbi:MAG: ferrous iron transport protein B, partial [Acholeplasmataceae bacterium]|nr:ferrous iron transport protein B [Acholeplasmataceae bacterium]
IVTISALKGTGIDDLISVIIKGFGKEDKPKIFSEDIEAKLGEIIEDKKHSRFLSVKLLERDLLVRNLESPELDATIRSLEVSYQSSLEEVIANKRYEWIDKVKAEAVIQKTRKVNWTDRLDKIFLNKYLGIPIFVIIMFLVYFLSVGLVGGATVSLIDNGVERLAHVTDRWLTDLGASSWSRSLLIDGVLSGVGAVLNFIPQLMMLFLCIALLETSGYMSRISFLLDKLLRRFGLSGKALVPFIVGSGCSVPGIMTTRTVEDSREREMLLTLTPFIPCSAKLPIIAFMAGFFFESYLGLITASLYFLSIIIILFSAVLMKKIFYKDVRSSYISELPEFKLPNARYVIRDVWDKTWGFIKRAGTIIFICSVIIWFLLSFSWKFEYGVDIEKSILASIGNLLSWIFYPILGELSWGATVSAIQGLVAKEQVVSSMSIIAGFSDQIGSGTQIFNSAIFSFFTPASAYAFMAFNLFSAPCLGAISAMHKEFGSTKKTLKAIAYQTALAWILATIIHLLGLLIMVIV